MDNKKYYCFCITINAQKESANPSKELAQYQSLIAKYYKTFFYVTNIHDKDIDDNGEDKRIHLHLYLEFTENNKFTCKQILTELANVVLHINKNQIQIEGTLNNYLYIQYIGSHKNNPEKYQYDHTKAQTNDLLLYEQRYNTKYEAPSNKDEEILNDLLTCTTIVDVAKKHGLSVANKYRNLYKDFQQAKHTDIKQLNDMLTCYEQFVKKLEDIIEHNKTFDNHIDVDLIINLIKTIFERSWCFLDFYIRQDRNLQNCLKEIPQPQKRKRDFLLSKRRRCPKKNIARFIVS